MKDVLIYDTTLRDGCQAEDISFTLQDKLRITEKLIELGIDYVEGGYPGSNPRDADFFRQVKKLKLKKTKIAAFGTTRRPSSKPSQDLNLKVLLDADTPVITLVGKSWDLHVRDDLRISKKANLEIITDSVAYMKSRVDEVIFDAEHFFDGYRSNPEYAIECLRAAQEGGADWIVLCDTNGGRLPSDIRAAITALAGEITTPLGIHCHNDGELAVANTMAAVEMGVRQVQGTINGFGERCGNLNLCSLIPNLQLKMGKKCIDPEQLKRVREVSHYFYELANIQPNKHQPYVGDSAFAHKGGLHVSGILKNRETYEHIDPELVGNRQRVLVSDLAGRSNIVYKAEEYGIELKNDDHAVQEILSRIKDLESQGYEFEAAEASFELLIQEALGRRKKNFRLVGFRVIDEKRKENEPPISEATIMVEVDGVLEHAAAMGNGPVNALDMALRKALTKFYPSLKEVELLDYKVRVLSSGEGTAASVRVLIESGDKKEQWGTVGVSHNVIEASWQAVVDSIDYKLYKDAKEARSKGAERQGVKAEVSGA
ncbi:MAG: citramalate synthase [Deltaproteobacteria bacterium GWA2_57_13]|nr:MAG: citramalate synthase [Deltaproteobacteria bacterium GWA2_57_13]OGQ48665.1 MAG: citramalate synthase [Deltaproteobacteria bacterium RIFCSPLOWO2_02_FULL_57_26]OGQ84994.1 MAG: citramalate synthase [Deltaproteobacteria bacterium RIFCSPLOWO2_12_FULL_57_22]